jgi:hypothetical protein
MADPSDEDAEVREHMAVLGPHGALAELRRVLEAPETYRTAVLRRFDPSGPILWLRDIRAATEVEEQT